MCTHIQYKALNVIDLKRIVCFFLFKGIFTVNIMTYYVYLSMAVFHLSPTTYSWVIMSTVANSLWRRYVCC